MLPIPAIIGAASALGGLFGKDSFEVYLQKNVQYLQAPFNKNSFLSVWANRKNIRNEVKDVLTGGHYFPSDPNYLNKVWIPKYNRIFNQIVPEFDEDVFNLFTRQILPHQDFDASVRKEYYEDKALWDSIWNRIDSSNIQQNQGNGNIVDNKNYQPSPVQNKQITSQNKQNEMKDFFTNSWEWIKSNPMISAVIAIVAYLMFFKKRR